LYHADGWARDPVGMLPRVAIGGKEGRRILEGGGRNMDRGKNGGKGQNGGTGSGTGTRQGRVLGWEGVRSDEEEGDEEHVVRDVLPHHQLARVRRLLGPLQEPDLRVGHPVVDVDQELILLVAEVLSQRVLVQHLRRRGAVPFRWVTTDDLGAPLAVAGDLGRRKFEN